MIEKKDSIAKSLGPASPRQVRSARTESRPLSVPTIPVFPQAAGPAVPETEIGARVVPGCSGMPGVWKSQPARQSSRIPGQDAVERPGGLDAVMEKVVQWKQENPASNGREMFDDFRLAGVTPVPSYG